jgi:hypothetical protein
LNLSFSSFGQGIQTNYQIHGTHSQVRALVPLILLQHEVFIQAIKDLGHINITLTKIIEKKKDSLLQLKNNKKIQEAYI